MHDKISQKPRGFAFIEYEHERDMHAAYKYADGKKIDGRRVLVDVERGRTTAGWLPRKLGGGLGGTRRGGPEQNAKHSGREDSRYGEDSERNDRFEKIGRDYRDRDDGSERNRDRGDRRDRDRRERDRDPDRKRRRSRSRDRERERGEREKRSRRSRSPRDRERMERRRAEVS